MVERDIHPDTYAEICDPAGFNPVVMYFIDWPGDPIYAHGNRGTISWNSQSWTGIGNVSDIRLPSDEFGMAAQEASFALLGLGDDLDTYLETDGRGAEATFYFGVVTERDGNTLIGEPFRIFSGVINGARDVTEFMALGYSRGGQLPLISGPSQRSTFSASHSHEDQSAAYPGDTGGRLLVNSEREAGRLRWPE